MTPWLIIMLMLLAPPVILLMTYLLAKLITLAVLQAHKQFSEREREGR